jgi:hypothetical protein
MGPVISAGSGSDPFLKSNLKIPFLKRWAVFLEGFPFSGRALDGGFFWAFSSISVLALI